MKSQKGITMLSLVIYVASFLAVTGLVAVITTFFYNNLKIINTDMGSSAYYNKLNLYMANEAKKSGNQICNYKSGDDVQNFVTFKDNSNKKNTFVKIGNIIYYNEFEGSGDSITCYKKIALCKNVNEFKINVDETSGKKVLKVYVNIDGTAYSTNYVVGD